VNMAGMTLQDWRRRRCQRCREQLDRPAQPLLHVGAMSARGPAMRDSFKCRCRRDGLDRLQRRDTAGAGIYRCSLGGGTLIALGVNDDQCADRNSFWNGTFTRRNATHADPDQVFEAQFGALTA
jgi:hypothetical protein